MVYMLTFTINIPQMLAYILYMDPMGDTSSARLFPKKISQRSRLRPPRPGSPGSPDRDASSCRHANLLVGLGDLLLRAGWVKWWGYKSWLCDGDLMEMWWIFDGYLMCIWWVYNKFDRLIDGCRMVIWWLYNWYMVRIWLTCYVNWWV